MPNLQNLFTILLQQAQPRSDIGGSWGSPEYLGTAPVATFLGRVVRPGDTLTSALARFPSESPEEPGAASPIVRAALEGGALSATQRQILRAINRADPEVLQALRRDPRPLSVFADPTLPADRLGQYYNGRTTQQIGIQPGVLAGRDIEGVPFGPQTGLNVENTVSTALHEALHFLNASRVAKTEPLDAATIAKLLQDYIPSLAGQGQIADAMSRKSFHEAMDEALSYLGEAATARNVPDPEIRTLYQALKGNRN